MSQEQALLKENEERSGGFKRSRDCSYLVRKASECQGENKRGCLNMFVVVESSGHPVAVSGQCALNWVPCA